MKNHDPIKTEFNTNTGVATIVFNKPEIRNAFDEHLIRLLLDTLKSLAKNPAVRLLVLKGAGDHFSAGADLNWMQRMAQQSLAENQKDAFVLAELMHELYTFPTVTLAMIQGSVFGGAVGWVACADIALAADNSVFCLSETKLGLIPAVIAPYLLQAIGERAAKRYMLSGESFNAVEAHHLGLIHAHMPIDILSHYFDHYIQKILNNSPEALIKTKAMIHTLSHKLFHNMHDKMHYTSNLIAEIRATPEAQKRLSAFLNKKDSV